ncbi:MAG TPA: hypothetical protein VGD54_07410, partial [Steroidobacteraceae bacterium]
MLPPRARREKPKVSAFTNANIERITKLKPGLVLGFFDLQAEEDDGLAEGWHIATRSRLRAGSTRLAALLHACALPPAGGCDLFQRVLSSHALPIHEALARDGILTRLFETPASLRFGLPRHEHD